MGTYHGMTLKSVTEGSQPKRPVTPLPQIEKPIPVMNPVRQSTKRGKFICILCFILFTYKISEAVFEK